jgi:hypothetical protein
MKKSKVTETVWRRIKHFVEVENPEKRRNSQSIRRLLFDTIYHEFDRSCHIASEKLKPLLKVARDRRGYHRNMSADSIYKVSRDIQFASYTHIDAIAQFHKVPMSVILLFTRIRSELESPDRRKSQEAMRIINAFQKALSVLETHTAKAGKSDDDVYTLIDYSVFQEFAEAYRETFNATMI